MNPLLVFLLLLKASATSFSGLTSLPVVRHDFVQMRHAMTDRELNAAVAAGRGRLPGPERPLPGQRRLFCGGLAGGMRRLRGVPRAGVSDHSDPALSGPARGASAVEERHPGSDVGGGRLVIEATVPLARDALTGWIPVGIAVASFLFLVLTTRTTLWVMAGAALVGLLALR